MGVGGGGEQGASPPGQLAEGAAGVRAQCPAQHPERVGTVGASTHSYPSGCTLGCWWRGSHRTRVCVPSSHPAPLRDGDKEALWGCKHLVLALQSAPWGAGGGAHISCTCECPVPSPAPHEDRDRDRDSEALRGASSHPPPPEGTAGCRRGGEQQGAALAAACAGSIGVSAGLSRPGDS